MLLSGPLNSVRDVSGCSPGKIDWLLDFFFLLLLLASTVCTVLLLVCAKHMCRISRPFLFVFGRHKKFLFYILHRRYVVSVVILL